MCWLRCEKRQHLAHATDGIFGSLIFYRRTFHWTLNYSRMIFGMNNNVQWLSYGELLFFCLFRSLAASHWNPLPVNRVINKHSCKCIIRKRKLLICALFFLLSLSLSIFLVTDEFKMEPKGGGWVQMFGKMKQFVDCQIVFTALTYFFIIKNYLNWVLLKRAFFCFSVKS